jgi:hypothetical protein
MNLFPNIISLLTLLIAVMAIYIARQQWITARNKLKLDLFNARFTLYVAAKKLISSILINGGISDVDLYSFKSNTNSARWMTNAEVATYFSNELFSRAVELNRLSFEKSSLRDEDEVFENGKQQAAIKQWFLSQFDVLDSKFSDLLQIG